jgi:malate dehydrogenase (oxaloacetate-decarboxylating)|tara:strand:- start:4551 stop:5996 length:1446 start_codon:yes stop_codon:yes gene_type:complete
MTKNQNYQDSPIGYELVLRLKIANEPGMLGEVTTIIGKFKSNIYTVDMVDVTPEFTLREFRISTPDQEEAHKLSIELGKHKGVEIEHASDITFEMHRKGKIEIKNKVPVNNHADLSHVYTPGVGRVCMAIHENIEAVWSLTHKANTVAIVTDGTAVLGLGDIGPEAAMPVMEGKAMLFKSFADIDAWPICLNTKNTEEIISIVKAISPGFGGILLEDISAPRCFEIEERLKAELDIPVFHDDQHGTAVVVLAGLINALKVVKKSPEDLKVVLVGVGASGVAVSKIMMNYGVKNIIGFDTTGAVNRQRENLNVAKQWFAENTNPDNFNGQISEAIKGADMFLGLSAPGVVTAEEISTMANDAIVFALANPDPEIRPEDIPANGPVKIIATGRSDYPNQINNVLCFPGLFRGAFDGAATDISEEMKIIAAKAIADSIPDDQITSDYILPSVFNRSVGKKVAELVKNEVIRSGNTRKKDQSVFL